MLPNLVLAGAPKSATSSIYDWLASHPQTCASEQKEPFYLMEEGHPLINEDTNYHTDGLSGYEELFSHCSSTADVVFEATTHYLYSQTAVDVLSRVEPVPHIVFSFRKPSERVYSAFRFTKYTLARMTEDLSFAEYVARARGEGQRSMEDAFENPEDAYGSSRIIELARYADHLPKWKEAFPEERLHFFLFEEIVADPESFMIELAGLLEIDAEFYEGYDFSKKNVSKTARNFALHRLAKQVARYIPTGRVKKMAKRAYRAFMTKGDANPRSGDEVAKRRLADSFEEHNLRFEEMTGLDVSERW